jgi:hypothetical protein
METVSPMICSEHEKGEEKEFSLGSPKNIQGFGMLEERRLISDSDDKMRRRGKTERKDKINRRRRGGGGGGRGLRPGSRAESNHPVLSWAAL